MLKLVFHVNYVIDIVLPLIYSFYSLKQATCIEYLEIVNLNFRFFSLFNY